MSEHNIYRDWLTESKSLENAQIVVDYLYTDNKDWSKKSICALLGNMRHESSINPNMYEYGYLWNQTFNGGVGRGFGLVQWTPRSKYWNWGVGKGYSESELRTLKPQLERIDYEVEKNIQWIAKGSNFNGLSFKQFRKNSKALTINELTQAFMFGYERPNYTAGMQSLPNRQAFARKCSEQLKFKKGNSTTPPKEIDPEVEEVLQVDPETNDKKEDPKEDFNGESLSNFLDEFYKKTMNAIEQLLTVNLYDYGKSGKFGNKFLSVDKTFNNIYKIKPTLNIKTFINEALDIGEDVLKDVIDGVKPKEEEKETTEPEPEEPEDPTKPDDKFYFPMKKNNAGINFFKRSNWGTGTLQKNMTYGVRSSGQFHSGMDIGTDSHDNYSVHAVRSGEVIFIGTIGGGGHTIQIKHSSDEYSSMYMHLKQDSHVVKVGDKVKAGQKIAIAGKTGGNYKIHLHFECTKTGLFHNEANTTDPSVYLKVTDDYRSSLPNPPNAT